MQTKKIPETTPLTLINEQTESLNDESGKSDLKSKEEKANQSDNSNVPDENQAMDKNKSSEDKFIAMELNFPEFLPENKNEQSDKNNAH